MLLLFVSFLVALIFSQRKKLKYSEHGETPEQRKTTHRSAVRSEETERHRIAETLHDEVVPLFLPLNSPAWNQIGEY